MAEAIYHRVSNLLLQFTHKKYVLICVYIWLQLSTNGYTILLSKIWETGEIEMKKKMIACILAIAALCSVTAFAAEGKEVNVRVNGYLVDFPDQKPYINADKRTLIPVRFVAEALGADVSWNAEFQGAEIKKDGITIQLPIGSQDMTVIKNGETEIVKLDTEAIKANGRTLVPIRAVAETLGAWVSYASAYATVEIYDDVLTPDEINELHSLPINKFWQISDEMKPLIGNATYENLHEYAFSKLKFAIHYTFRNRYTDETWDSDTGTVEELSNLYTEYIPNGMAEYFTIESCGAHASFRTDASCMFTSPAGSDVFGHPYINYGYLTITFDKEADIERYKSFLNTSDFGNIKPGGTYTYIIESIWMLNVASGGGWNMGYFDRTNGKMKHWG